MALSQSSERRPSQEVDPDIAADLRSRIAPERQGGVVVAAAAAKVEVVPVSRTDHARTVEVAIGQIDVFMWAYAGKCNHLSVEDCHHDGPGNTLDAK